MTLHILSQSPENGPALASCLRTFSTKDALLLINDGVYALQSQRHLLAPLINQNQVFALHNDQTLRGLAPEAGISIDYSQFVALCVEHNPIQSWY